MESPPTSSLCFLDLAGNYIDEPLEWTPALVEVPSDNWKEATLIRQHIHSEEILPLSMKRVGEQWRVVADWPRPHGSHTNQRKSYRPFSNEFEAPVTTDLVPPGSVCDWCDQTAERRLTVIGGSWHDKTGAFCSSCGQRFVEKVVNA